MFVFDIRFEVLTDLPVNAAVFMGSTLRNFVERYRYYEVHCWFHLHVRLVHRAGENVCVCVSARACAWVCVRVCMCMYARERVRLLAHVRACCVSLPARVRESACARARVCMRACMYARAPACACACVRAPACARVCARARARVCERLNERKFKPKHIYLQIKQQWIQSVHNFN